MEIFCIPLVITVIGGIIVLAVEYWGIQPLRSFGAIKLFSLLFPFVRRDWTKATRTVINKFKSQPKHYKWIIGQNDFKVENLKIEKGKGTLNLAVTTNNNLLSSHLFGKIFPEPLVIERYEILFDRTGDILRIRSVPVEIEVNIIQLEKLTTEKSRGGITAVVSFLAGNRGQRGEFCVKIELDIVTLRRSDGKFGPEKHGAIFGPFEIDGFSVKKFGCKLECAPPAVPLVDSQHKVRISIIPCPAKQN